MSDVWLFQNGVKSFLAKLSRHPASCDVGELRKTPLEENLLKPYWKNEPEGKFHSIIYEYL